MSGSSEEQTDGSARCAWCGRPVLLAFAKDVPVSRPHGDRVYRFHETCFATASCEEQVA